MFVDFLIGPVAQLIFGKAGLLPTATGISDKLDAGLQQMANQKLLPKVDIDEMSEIVAKAVRPYDGDR